VLVRGPEGPITDAGDAAPGMAVTLQFRENRTREAVIREEAETEAPKPARKKRTLKNGNGRQGSLL
jgi:hypothetical protein